MYKPLRWRVVTVAAVVALLSWTSTSNAASSRQGRDTRPILTISNYSVEPSRVVAGREFVVTIELYNAGNQDGDDTIATFPGGVFLPVGNTGHLLGKLVVGHAAVITQTMRAPISLGSGSYNLNVNLSATDGEPDNNRYEYPQVIAVEAIGAGSGRPQLVVESSETDPAVLVTGDAFDLTLRVVNRGTRTANRVVVGVASNLAVPAGGSNVVAIDHIGVDKVVTVTSSLVLGDVAQAGRVGLDVSLSYGGSEGGTYSDYQSVGLEVSTAAANRPQLLVAGYRTEPSSLALGDLFTLTLEVTNVGGGDAQRLTLTLGGEGGSGLAPFAPLRSSNVKFVPRLAARDTVEVMQPLVVDGGANPGAYSLPVALAYDDIRGTRHTDSQLISLLVRRQPHLQIGFYTPIETITVGAPFKLPVEVINVGRALVNVSTLVVSSPQLEISEGSIYLGPLDGGTSGSLEATAMAQQDGSADVLATVHYLDDFDQPQVLTTTLTVKVEQPLETTPQVERVPQTKSLWDIVLRFLRGLLGLGN